MRKGELLSLTWDKVNFDLALLSVAGETAKSGKTRHIPLNDEALTTLKNWRAQTHGQTLVFSNRDGNQFGEIKKSWATILKIAEIDNFRWHDLRHHFASRLAMAGVDLNTIRELLGHSDIKMTLRYAHLAPEHKADAVAKLGNARIT
jgi:integrase